MAAKISSLVEAVSALKNVLSERATASETSGLRQMDSYLARIERAAQQHRRKLGEGNEEMVNVDTPLTSSPTVARRTDALRQELDALVQEATRLRRQAQTVHPVATAVNPATAAGALPVSPEAADVADLGVFYERLEQLLDRFEHFEEDETELIQDSVTLDLGAGD
jgi:hypothetical protein